MNTILAYMYRDAANYKQHDRAIFTGAVTDEERVAFSRACVDGEYFIASQIGLVDLQPRMDNFPDEDDHVWSEFEGFELSVDVPTHGSIHDFIASLAGIKWDVAAAAARLGLPKSAA